MKLKPNDLLDSIRINFFSAIFNSWQRFALSFILGALGSFAFAPLFIFPALLLSLSGGLFLLNNEIEKKSSFFKIFCLGWFFGFGHFTVGLYWITLALTTDLAFYWFLFSLLGIPGYLALFFGFSFFLTALWPYKGLSRGLAFCAIWVGMEWLRGNFFIEFPWNFVGYGWAFSLEMMQTASFVSIYGLSLLTLLMAMSLPYLLGKRSFERNIAFCIYLMVGLCWIAGKYRLNHQDNLSPSSFAIRLVQPNNHYMGELDPQHIEKNFQALLKMTAQPSSLPLKAIVWPESAVLYFLELDSSSRRLIGKALPKGALLFTGAPRRKELEKKPVQIWNSFFVLNDQGHIVTHYDKSRLVPFGEYIPLKSTLETIFGEGTIKNRTMGNLDLTTGTGIKPLTLPKGFPTCMGLICYEIIFPHGIVNPIQERPEWIINVSNDGWYRNTFGPHQHLEMARFRAIEQGLPLVRVANTGISAVFDAYGQPIGMIPLNNQGILDVFLPLSLPFVPFYAQWGDWITLILIGGVLTLAFLVSLKERYFNFFSLEKL